RSRPVEGAILLGGGTLAGTLAPTLKRLSNELVADRDGLGELTRWTGAGKLQALVFDASDLHSADQLIALQRFFQPALPHLARCPHIVVIGRAPESLSDPFAASAQRSLEGFTRSLAKEVRRGGTVQLLYVAEDAENQLEGALRFLLSPKRAYVSGRVSLLRASPAEVTGGGRTVQLLYVAEDAENQLEGALRFFLSPKSAYVSGQVIRLRANRAEVKDWSRPLAGRRALVTGASRGIGAAIAETLARDGAD